MCTEIQQVVCEQQAREPMKDLPTIVGPCTGNAYGFRSSGSHEHAPYYVESMVDEKTCQFRKPRTMPEMEAFSLEKPSGQSFMVRPGLADGEESQGNRISRFRKRRKTHGNGDSYRGVCCLCDRVGRRCVRRRFPQPRLLPFWTRTIFCQVSPCENCFSTQRLILLVVEAFFFVGLLWTRRKHVSEPGTWQRWR